MPRLIPRVAFSLAAAALLVATCGCQARSSPETAQPSRRSPSAGATPLWDWTLPTADPAARPELPRSSVRSFTPHTRLDDPLQDRLARSREKPLEKYEVHKVRTLKVEHIFDLRPVEYEGGQKLNLRQVRPTPRSSTDPPPPEPEKP